MIILENDKLNLIFTLIPLYERVIFEYGNKQLKLLKNLNKSQILTLAVLKNNMGISMSEMAERLGLENSSFTTVANKLVELGYIKKQKNSEDKREYLLFLTEEGFKIAEYTNQEHIRNLTKQLDQLTEEEEILFFKSLKDLQSLLKKMD